MTATKITLTRADYDRAISLREAVTDYILADALDGVYREAEWTQLHAAFTTTDNGALAELARDLKRPINFIEPATIVKGLAKAARKDLDTGKLTKLIRETPGTRLYARDLLTANIEETPFG